MWTRSIGLLIGFIFFCNCSSPNVHSDSIRRVPNSELNSTEDLKTISKQNISKIVKALETKKVNLTDEEGIALHSYTSFSFGEINYSLRSKSTPTNLMKSVCVIDTAINKNVIGSISMYLFRGHTFLPDGASKIGYSFSDKAFISTSLSIEVAERYAKNGINQNQPSVVDIFDFNKMSVEGVWLNSLSRWGKSSSDSNYEEMEILLKRNLTFRVVKVQVVSGITYRLLEPEYQKQKFKDSNECSN